MAGLMGVDAAFCKANHRSGDYNGMHRNVWSVMSWMLLRRADTEQKLCGHMYDS